VLAHHGEIQAFLAREMVVDGRETHTGPLHNVLHTRSTETFGNEDFGCRGNQACPGFFA
jgi:hypothetical protein